MLFSSKVRLIASSSDSLPNLGGQVMFILHLHKFDIGTGRKTVVRFQQRAKLFYLGGLHRRVHKDYCMWIAHGYRAEFELPAINFQWLV